MTVKELIEINQMIVDVEITIRKDGTALLDQLNIGPAEGVKPPYPTMVPKEERYIGNQSLSTKREAYYIDKSINAWDDGKDYWQVKLNRIPTKWLDLEVFSWSVTPASTISHGRRTNYNFNFPNVNFHGQRLSITALPSGETMEIKKEIKKDEPKSEPMLPGQMSLEEWLGGANG